MSETKEHPSLKPTTEVEYEIWENSPDVGFGWSHDDTVGTLKEAREIVHEWRADDAQDPDAEPVKYCIIKVTSKETREVRR